MNNYTIKDPNPLDTEIATCVASQQVEALYRSLSPVELGKLLIIKHQAQMIT